MCTAISYSSNGQHFFGRNLDLELSYGQQVTITPRNYPFRFRKVDDLPSHYALIGMASVVDGYPLYFEASNEKGLSMAGLNFPQNAYYFPDDSSKENVAPFEFIPYILGQCQSVDEAKNYLANLNLVDIDFSEQLPLSPLHWLLSDKDQSIVIESTASGLNIYDDPIGLLTNNPPFEKQLFSLNNYRQLSPRALDNTFSDKLSLESYSRGMGAIGLPGDLSSQSRYVRAAFTKLNVLEADTKEGSISQFFHILKSVEQQKGACDLGDGKYEFTIYSSCCHVEEGVYYYTTYDNSQIRAVNMYHADLDGKQVLSYPLLDKKEAIHFQN